MEKETKWIEVEGRRRFATLARDGTGHWWYDTFGDVVCAGCDCLLWDDPVAKEPCKNTSLEGRPTFPNWHD